MFALLLVLSALAVSFALPPKAAQTSGAAAVGNTVWVIDAGHGGEDGGAVGADGSRESDMNLAIARRLDALLVFLGEETRMTRTEDISIHDASASTLREKKRSDLENRVGLVNSTQGAILVSIHQNSYPDPAIKGAQVFYYTSSVEGKQLAKRLQERLVKGLDPQNHRQAKANDSYYLLKKTACPIVIVECGFLSNPQEEALLTDSVYQERVAWNIFMGIMQELKRKKA